MGAPGRCSGGGTTGAPGGGLGRRSWGCANASVHRPAPADNTRNIPNPMRCLMFIRDTFNPYTANDVTWAFRPRSALVGMKSISNRGTGLSQHKNIKVCHAVLAPQPRSLHEHNLRPAGNPRF